MAQTVCHKPSTTQAEVLFQLSPCGICGGTWTVSSPVSSVIIPPVLPIHFSFMHEQSKTILANKRL
jgi:hypothetical protein